ncbi:MAG: hypothetical protein GY950_24010 [bacterium]|nr:hypothetical protein [bacterium]
MVSDKINHRIHGRLRRIKKMATKKHKNRGAVPLSAARERKRDRQRRVGKEEFTGKEAMFTGLSLIFTDGMPTFTPALDIFTGRE